ncbi:MAG: RNA polymerase sigma factor [Anaerolineae bacterium]
MTPEPQPHASEAAGPPEGDEQAGFTVLYQRYAPSVYRYVYSYVGNAADAEDLTATVFMQALEARGRYRERGRFAAWLFAIARRRAVDHHRQRQRLATSLDCLGEQPGAGPGPEEALLTREALERLASLLEDLTEDERELLRLRFAAGLSYGEMGAVVGRSEAATRMAMHRLLRRLQDRWRAGDGE